MKITQMFPTVSITFEVEDEGKLYQYLIDLSVNKCHKFIAGKWEVINDEGECMTLKALLADTMLRH